MNIFGRTVYACITGFFRIYIGLFFDAACWGIENVPPGPKIFCSNHFSSSDPFFAMSLLREPVHMVLGAAYGFPVIPFFLNVGEQIDAFGDAKKDVVSKAVRYLKKGESVYIFPEGELGDQTELRKFYYGLAKIYLEYPVPIIPIGLVSPRRNVREKDVHIREVMYHRLVIASKNYYANIGKPIRFPEFEDAEDRPDAERSLTEAVKSQITFLIQDIKENKFWS